MPALLDVSRGSAESANEKIAEPLFGALHVLLRVHGSQDVVVVDLPVEDGNEGLEALFADQIVNLVFLYHFQTITV